VNFENRMMPAENLQHQSFLYTSDQLVQNYFRQHQSLSDMQ